MMEYYPVVVERENNGTYSAWVAGLPGVYAAADTAVVAKRAIRFALAAHLDTLKSLGHDPKPKSDVLVLRHDTRARTSREALQFVGLGALMAKTKTSAKAEAARRNGRKGGRPRKVATKTARRVLPRL
jgi:predicted RNase H-like HicB family nuclease